MKYNEYVNCTRYQIGPSRTTTSPWFAIASIKRYLSHGPCARKSQTLYSINVTRNSNTYVSTFLLPIKCVCSRPRDLCLSFKSICFFFRHFSMEVNAFSVGANGNYYQCCFPTTLRKEDPMDGLIYLIRNYPGPSLRDVMFVKNYFSPGRFSLFIYRPFNKRITTRPSKRPTVFNGRMRKNFIPISMILFLPNHYNGFRQMGAIRDLPQLCSSRFNPDTFRNYPTLDLPNYVQFIFFQGMSTAMRSMSLLRLMKRMMRMMDTFLFRQARLRATIFIIRLCPTSVPSNVSHYDISSGGSSISYVFIQAPPLRIRIHSLYQLLCLRCHPVVSREFLPKFKEGAMQVIL